MERQKSEIGSLINEFNGLVIDQDKEYFNMLDLHIKSLSEREPFKIDFFEELNNFLHAGLLRPFETQAIKMKYLEAVLDQRVAKIMRLCFWCILCTRFPETVNVLVQEELQTFYKGKLSKNYVKLFQKLPQPKDELVSYVAFTVAYLVHFCFYKYFPPQREYFDFRFVLNCYHTVIFEFNGLFVSDFYVKMMIEKFFTHHFLDYEKKNIKELLQRQLELKKLNNKKFLGFELRFPELSNTSKDGHEFKEKIMTVLKRDKKQFSMITELKDKSSRNLSRTIEGGEYFSGNRTKSMNSDKNDSQSIHGSFHKNERSSNKTRMNCNQVSPTLGQLLQYQDLSLPYMKKKMIKHVLEKPDAGQQDLLVQMKQMLQHDKIEQAAKKKKEIHIAARGKTLIDQYGLRQPPKEYYQQFSKQDLKFKEMLDINYILQEQNDNFSKLPSSIELLNLYNNKLASRMATQINEKAMQDKVEHQQKQLKHIDNVKIESGNQDIFDMPYTGTRSEGRKMIAYVRSKCRKQLDESEENDIKNVQQQKESSTVNKLSKMTQQYQSLPAINHVNPVESAQQEAYQLLPNTSKKSILQTMGAVTANLKNLSNALNTRQETLLNKTDSENFTKTQQTKLIPKKIDIPAIGGDSSQIFQQNDLSEENHRKIVSKIVQKETNIKSNTQGNLPEFIFNRTLDANLTYEDKRHSYKKKYNQIFENISVDQNINELFSNIHQKSQKSSKEDPDKFNL